MHADLEEALHENRRLRDEVERLKRVLATNSIPLSEIESRDASSASPLPAVSDVAQSSGPMDKESKAALFRSLFRGREDVYAERWRLKNGGWGYRPAGRQNWDAILASRPEEQKKVGRQTRTLYPLTDEVLRLHLCGKKTIGIYPLLADETCWPLAADFDKTT